MVEASGLIKTYQTADGDLRALDGVSLSVARGEFASIVGPSGCGKTTLLKIIGDLVEPTSGSVRVGGQTAREARLRGAFSYVCQNPVLLPWRRVIDNVRLPLEIRRRQGRDPSSLLHMAGLEDYQNLYPRELSGGMQQRVALARALTFDPQLLLMDEPFGALDELTRGSLNVQLLRIWQETGVTVIFITHSIPEAVFLSDRVVVLSARPARVDYVLDVAARRPRRDGFRDSEEFTELVKCLRDKLE